MKLAGRFRIVIEGDLADQVTAGGRSTNVIGYLMERLLTGQAAAVETELETWGIRVRDGRSSVGGDDPCPAAWISGIATGIDQLRIAPAGIRRPVASSSSSPLAQT